MKIETKFNIGDRVWVVYEYDSEIRVYSDYIKEILIHIMQKSGNTHQKQQRRQKLEKPLTICLQR